MNENNSWEILGRSAFCRLSRVFGGIISRERLSVRGKRRRRIRPALLRFPERAGSRNGGGRVTGSRVPFQCASLVKGTDNACRPRGEPFSRREIVERVPLTRFCISPHGIREHLGLRMRRGWRRGCGRGRTTYCRPPIMRASRRRPAR